MDVLKVIHLLGRGSYGDVYRVHLTSSHDKENSSTAAGKLVPFPPSLLSPPPSTTTPDPTTQSLQREIAVLSTLHSHKAPTTIISFLGLAKCGKNKTWILLELCPFGSLSQILTHAHPTGLPASIASHALQSVSSALAWLHSPPVRIAHGDIKAANILVAADGSVKIADFGTAVGLDAPIHPSLSPRERAAGSPHWMAPELMMGGTRKRPDGVELGLDKADVWALGITAIELATGSPPHADLDPIVVLSRLSSTPPPRLSGSRFPRGLRKFVSAALVADPEMRASASDLSSMPFVASRNRAKRGKAALLSLCHELEAILGNASVHEFEFDPANASDSMVGGVGEEDPWLLETSESILLPSHSVDHSALVSTSALSFLTATPSPRANTHPPKIGSSSSSSSYSSSSYYSFAIPNHRSLSSISPASSDW